MKQLQPILVFLTIVEEKSFSKAAKVLNISASAVSKHLSKLEIYLEIKLFNRTTRKLSLTEEGEIYYQSAKKALANLEAGESIIREMKQGPTGRLKISIPNDFSYHNLIKPIANFSSLYPNISLEIQLTDEKVDVDEYDCVIRIGELVDSSYMYRNLAEVSLLICACPNYLKKHGIAKVPEDLKKYQFIAYENTNRSFSWRYQSPDGEVGQINLNVLSKSNSGEMIREMVILGQGVMIAPIFLVNQELKEGRLIQLLPEYTTLPKTNVYIVFSKNNFISKRLRLFIDYMSEQAKHLFWVT